MARLLKKLKRYTLGIIILFEELYLYIMSRIKFKWNQSKADEMKMSSVYVGQEITIDGFDYEITNINDDNCTLETLTGFHVEYMTKQELIEWL